MHVRTATLLSAGESGRASSVGVAEVETMGGRVITGLPHIVVGFNT